MKRQALFSAKGIKINKNNNMCVVCCRFAWLKLKSYACDAGVSPRYTYEMKLLQCHHGDLRHGSGIE